MHKFIDAFKKVGRGEEELKKVLLTWGLMPILIDLLIIEKFINKVHFAFLEILIAVIVILYFAWHLVSIRRSIPEYKLPKKERIKLKKQRKEELKKLKAEKGLCGISGLFKSFVRKLFLRDSWSRFSLTKVIIIADLLVITTHFLNLLVNLGHLLK